MLLWPMVPQFHPLLASVQGTSSPSCPTPWSPRTRWRRTAPPVQVRGGACWGGRGLLGKGALQRPCFASCQGGPGQRKDFRVNTCTAPRGTFLLEPLGVCPSLEPCSHGTRRVRTWAGTRRAARPLFGPACWAGPLLAGSAQRGPAACCRAVFPCPQFWPAWGLGGTLGSRADRVRSLLSVEPGRAEERPMEVSVCGSPGPALSTSRAR